MIGKPPAQAGATEADETWNPAGVLYDSFKENKLEPSCPFPAPQVRLASPRLSSLPSPFLFPFHPALTFTHSNAQVQYQIPPKTYSLREMPFSSTRVSSSVCVYMSCVPASWLQGSNGSLDTLVTAQTLLTFLFASYMSNTVVLTHHADLLPLGCHLTTSTAG